jgi:hypothetical protein
MSTCENHDRKAVIVRGWGNEPVKLFLHRIENNRCYVGKEDSEESLSLPMTDVLTYDDTLFGNLHSAYSQQDTALLCELYDKALDDFTCIRNKNKVESSHDQEGVPNTSAVEVSDSQ